MNDTEFSPASQNERLFLCACMQDVHCLATFAGTVSADWFYDDRNRQLWTYLLERMREERDFDLAICMNALKGRVESGYIAEVSIAVPTSALADEYVAAIRVAYQTRQLLVLASALPRKVATAQDALGYAQRELER
ncbi:MAG: DnaB-like helicase N-terminal domain-containing protein, partial [Chthoniobacterales bacterium]